MAGDWWNPPKPPEDFSVPNPGGARPGAMIPQPVSPISGMPAIPGSPGYDPYGYPLGPGGSREKFGGHPFFKRLFKQAPPFLSDMSMYNTAISTVNDILSRHGQLDPEILARQQAGLEASRQNAQRSLSQSLARSGVDPGSAEGLAMSGGIQQSADRAQQDARFRNAQAASEQERSDLNLVIPWMQQLFGYAGPKQHQVQITPTPSGQHTDWAGIGAQLASPFLSSYANSLFRQTPTTTTTGGAGP